MADRIKKYNPAFLSGEELVKTFVVRHAELELIVQVIRENVTGSNQHVLVIGPRGIGKTMLVLRVAEEIRENEDLSQRWYPLVFAEESYPVSTAGEFWLEALFHLSHQTDDIRWQRSHEELMGEQDEERLRERALAQLMDFADIEGKRILLIVENFNMLVGDQISDDDGWKLRHTLLHEPRVMLLASATSGFEGIENADKPMFELFKLHELKALEEEECQILWGSITEREAGDERVRPLQILTGGNPRLLVIVSSFAARMSLRQLMDDLMHLVDENTEYFKSHLDSLPAIERKVYLALAELWDPVTAREVAAAARLGVSKSSALLRRLMERGMVVEADGERRAKLYQVAERMYNIYYLMRRRGAPSRRVKAVVRFMVSFYEPEELVSLTQQIAEEACELGPTLRREHYFAYEAILESTSTEVMRKRLIKAAPQDFFKMPDVPISIKELIELEKNKYAKAREGKVVELLKEGEELEEADKLKEAERVYRKAIGTAPKKAAPWAHLGLLFHEKLERYEEAEQAYRKAIELEPKLAWGWALLGQLFDEKLERYGEAEKAYRKAIEIKAEYAWAWARLGLLLDEKLERYEEAEKAYRKGIEIEPKVGWGYAKLGQLLHQLERYEEAEEAYRKAIEIDAEHAGAWAGLGFLLYEKLERYDEAEKAYRKAIEIDAEYAGVWAGLGMLLDEKLERYDEAEKAYRKSVEIDAEQATVWAALGLLLDEKLERYDEAEKAYRRAVEVDAEYAWAWGHLGQLLHEKLERYEEAEEAYHKAIDIDETRAWTWAKLGRLLDDELERYGEAEQAYRKAIELKPEVPFGWGRLAELLHYRLENYDEAEELYRRALELQPDYAMGWVELGELLHEKLERYEAAEKAYRKAIELLPQNSVAWEGLAGVLMKAGRERDVLELAEEYVARDSKNAGLRNTLAWMFYDLRLEDYLKEAQTWAREAVGMEPENVDYKHTLASILGVSGKGPEALELAREYLKETDVVDKTIDDAIDLFVGLAAAGYMKEALEVLRDSPSAEILEPLVVGLRMYVGEDVKAAAEIMEVGRDVVKRIEERRKEMEADRAGDR